MCCGCMLQVLTTQLEGEVEVKLDTFKEVRVASKNCSHAWVFTLRTKKRPLVLKDCALMDEEARHQFNLVSITVKAIKSGKSIITRSYTMQEVRQTHVIHHPLLKKNGVNKMKLLTRNYPAGMFTLQ